MQRRRYSSANTRTKHTAQAGYSKTKLFYLWNSFHQRSVEDGVPKIILLRIDFISGFYDGTLDLDKLDFISFYWNAQVYQSFPKNVFRIYLRNTIVDHRTAIHIRYEWPSSKSIIILWILFAVIYLVGGTYFLSQNLIPKRKPPTH